MNVTAPSNYVELDTLFQRSSLSTFNKDVLLAEEVDPTEYENSLDAKQKKNIEKNLTGQNPAILVLGINILQSFAENNDPATPTTKHQRIYEYIVASDTWVHEVLAFTFSKIRTSTFFYNLNHIVDGDENGGKHVYVPTVNITPIFENTRNGVVYGSYQKDLSDKKSTFFPKWMNTKSDFLNFMGGCELVARTDHSELLYSLENNIYVVRFMRYAQRTIPSAFPCLGVIDFHTLDQNNPQVHEDEYLTIFNRKDQIFSNDPAFESEEAAFYDLNDFFQLPGIYLKCKKGF